MSSREKEVLSTLDKMYKEMYPISKTEVVVKFMKTPKFADMYSFADLDSVVSKFYAGEGPETFGEMVKRYRISHGMTLEQFGKEFDPVADKSVVARWEKGEWLPNLSRLRQLSDMMGVPLEKIIEYTSKIGGARDVE